MVAVCLLDRYLSKNILLMVWSPDCWSFVATYKAGAASDIRYVAAVSLHTMLCLSTFYTVEKIEGCYMYIGTR